jgi:hypothetical protein
MRMEWVLVRETLLLGANKPSGWVPLYRVIFMLTSYVYLRHLSLLYSLTVFLCFFCYWSLASLWEERLLSSTFLAVMHAWTKPFFRYRCLQLPAWFSQELPGIRASGEFSPFWIFSISDYVQHLPASAEECHRTGLIKGIFSALSSLWKARFAFIALWSLLTSACSLLYHVAIRPLASCSLVLSEHRGRCIFFLWGGDLLCAQRSILPLSFRKWLVFPLSHRLASFR